MTRLKRRVLFWLQARATRLANMLNVFASRCYYKAITAGKENR